MILKKAQESRKEKKFKKHRKLSYNTKMLKQSEVNPRKKLTVYKVDDMVSTKIDREDKK